MMATLVFRLPVLALLCLVLQACGSEGAPAKKGMGSESADDPSGASRHGNEPGKEGIAPERGSRSTGKTDGTRGPNTGSGKTDRYEREDDGLGLDDDAPDVPDDDVPDVNVEVEEEEEQDEDIDFGNPDEDAPPEDDDLFGDE